MNNNNIINGLGCFVLLTSAGDIYRGEYNGAAIFQLNILVKILKGLLEVLLQVLAL